MADFDPSDLSTAVQLVATEAAAIGHLARYADLSTPIEHLGRWKIRDVIAHLGGVHRWAARIVEQRSMAGPGFRKSKLRGGELCDWFDAGAQQLVELLSQLDADEPCPNFNPGSSRTVGWWMRRQLHETTVHRWDVEAGLGETTSIDPVIAGDGIDEFLDVFVRTRGKLHLDSTVQFETTRPKRRWTLTPADKPGRIDVVAGQTPTADTKTLIRGRPSGLLLALWGRQSVEQAGLTIEGTADVSSLLGRPSG